MRGSTEPYGLPNVSSASARLRAFSCGYRDSFLLTVGPQSKKREVGRQSYRPSADDTLGGRFHAGSLPGALGRTASLNRADDGFLNGTNSVAGAARTRKKRRADSPSLASRTNSGISVLLNLDGSPESLWPQMKNAKQTFVDDQRSGSKNKQPHEE